MVKSIRDGDSVARLQTVTIADYNSTTPLPQRTPQPPPPNSPSSHRLFRWSVGTSEGFREGKGWRATLDRRGGFRGTKEKGLQWKRRGREENRHIRRSWTHNAVSLFSEKGKKEPAWNITLHFTQLLPILLLLLLHFPSPSHCRAHAFMHAYRHAHTEYFFFFFCRWFGGWWRGWVRFKSQAGTFSAGWVVLHS